MRLKQLPEDFVVEEVMQRKPSGTGAYLWFTLKKKNIGALEAVQTLSRIWNVPAKKIGFAGLKDKQAVTTQTCSVQHVSAERIAHADERIETVFIGFDENPVSLGSHTANKFTLF